MIASNLLTYMIRFAQGYNCNSYGANAYGECAAQSSSGLADTGIAIILFASVAFLLICIALIVRFWRRDKNKTPPASPKTPSSL